MIVSLNPKYIPLVQKPSCCNITCLQMILYRRGFGLFDQQELAKYFKVKVSKNDLNSFNVKLGIYKKNCDEGLETIESKDVVNRFFRSRKIPLTANSIRSSEIKDLKTFIVSNLKNNNDLWMEYKTHEIHGEKLIHDNEMVAKLILV